MEGLRKISVLLTLVAILQLAASHMDLRTSLHIPEKIIGGVIDIVHSHKNKPGQTTQQYQPNQNYQYPQYQQWNQPGNYQGQAQYQGQYQGQQGQLQGQMQGQNQGQYYPQATGYPQNNAPVSTYPQPSYPVNSVQYPVQGASQSQAQGQYQYPQNAGQFQGQNQQGNGQYQGQVQQQTGFQTGQNQYPSQTGQNQYPSQTGQNQYPSQTSQNQYPSQASQFQGQTQATGQYTGQEVSSGHFQAVQGSAGSQGSGFQVTGGHTGNQGPACVCQAWTKPNATKGEATLENTEKTEV